MPTPHSIYVLSGSIHQADWRFIETPREVLMPRDSGLNVTFAVKFDMHLGGSVACQISEQYNYYNIQSHVMETSLYEFDGTILYCLVSRRSGLIHHPHRSLIQMLQPGGLVKNTDIYWVACDPFVMSVNREPRVSRRLLSTWQMIDPDISLVESFWKIGGGSCKAI